MSPTRIRPAAVTTAALLTVLTSSVLAGCSISRDDSPSAATSGDQAGATASVTPSASAAPTPTSSASAPATPAPTVTASAAPTTAAPTSTATSTAAPTPAATPAAALLAAGQLPRLNATSAWTQGRTGSIGSRPFGLCQKFDLLSIGATDAVERSFTTGSGGVDSAAQQVAEFPDAQNAVRASKVVEAWHRDCAGRVRGTAVTVRPFTDVAVPAGRGSAYLVSYERNGEGHFHSLGMVVSGARLTLLRIDHGGQDHDYAPGQDPMQLAVKAAAAKLG